MNNRASHLIVLLLSFTAAIAFAKDQPTRRVGNFNRDWKFAKGTQIGAETVEFEDAGWLARK